MQWLIVGGLILHAMPELRVRGLVEDCYASLLYHVIEAVV